VICDLKDAKALLDELDLDDPAQVGIDPSGWTSVMLISAAQSCWSSWIRKASPGF